MAKGITTADKVSVYKVCILHTFHDSFDYLAGDEKPAIGARVWVPFGSKTRLGIVVAAGLPEKEIRPLKTISALIDFEAVVSADVLSLCQWISKYYHAPLSEVLALALPKKIRQGASAALQTEKYYQLAMPAAQACQLIAPRAVKQHALIDYLHQQAKPTAKDRLTALQFTTNHLKALAKKNILQCNEQISLPPKPHVPRDKPLTLNDEQAQAVLAVTNQLASYHCFLLQGVTGSGKTEIYLQVIAQVLAESRQALVLVPEIGLTPQLLSRFQARFDESIAVLHSGLNESERLMIWQLAQKQLIKLVIGTRTAVFTPMPALGIIIIDEEHDASFKQMEGVRYSARDTALIRAHNAAIPIILGSATPCLESLYNCQQHKYSLLRLSQRALTTQPLHFTLVDLRNSQLQHGLVEQTIQQINAHLLQQKQVMVFINRRGFAPVILCHHCGWMADCQACDSHMTLHKKTNQLLCHHCGFSCAIPIVCLACQSRELLPVGSGTQRIHEYLQQLFPNVNLLRLDRDMIKGKNDLARQLALIHQEKIQLIVGTQMIAKGHHFPNLTLVVIANADAGFYNQDFRAIEQLGQLLIQVAGRAGRAQHAGEVLIQTHLPHHPLLNTLIQQGYDAFAHSLLITREQAGLPPYSHLAIIRVQHRQKEKLMTLLAAVKDYLISHAVQTLGPAPAPLAKKANLYRMQLLIKAPSRKQLHGALTAMRKWLTINKLNRGIQLTIDVDPQDLS